MKIGKTANLKQRLRNLDNNSVPLPFRCEYASRVSDIMQLKSLCMMLLVTDARYRESQALFDGKADHAHGSKAKRQKT